MSIETTQENIERIQRALKYDQDILNHKQAKLGWLQDHLDTIAEVGCAFSITCTSIDFDNPTREQVLALIKAFPGTWNKVGLDIMPGMVYMTEFQGQSLRIWNAPVLETCKLIEYEVEIPAQKVKKYKLDCKPALKEEV